MTEKVSIEKMLDRVATALENACGELREIKAMMGEMDDPKMERNLSDLEYGLSVRALNVLHSIKCYTVGDLLRLRTDNLMNLRACGRKTKAEIEDLARKVRNGKDNQ